MPQDMLQQPGLAEVDAIRTAIDELRAVTMVYDRWQTLAWTTDAEREVARRRGRNLALVADALSALTAR